MLRATLIISDLFTSELGHLGDVPALNALISCFNAEEEAQESEAPHSHLNSLEKRLVLAPLSRKNGLQQSDVQPSFYAILSPFCRFFTLSLYRQRDNGY